MVNLLFGAVGRHNFGDLLFPHIIEALFPDKQFTVCDLVSRDMREHGGHTVESIFDYFGKECNNVILVGGNVGNCNGTQAAEMLDVPPFELPLPYIFDRNKAILRGKLIANSIGGVEDTTLLREYDYVGVRDSASLKHSRFHHAPDSACLTRRLFDSKIQNSTASDSIKEVMGEYTAVQVCNYELEKQTDRICQLVEQEESIVFFCAGTAANHDSLENYAKVFDPSRAYFADQTNIWDICSIIAGAKKLMATSLHAHIIAKLYEVETVTLTDQLKVRLFNREWASLPTTELENRFLKSLEMWDIN